MYIITVITNICIESNIKLIFPNTDIFKIQVMVCAHMPTLLRTHLLIVCKNS